MATTKVIADLTDLNKANTTKSLKMPSGGAFSGTVTEGRVKIPSTLNVFLSVFPSLAAQDMLFRYTEW